MRCRALSSVSLVVTDIAVPSLESAGSLETLALPGRPRPGTNCPLRPDASPAAHGRGSWPRAVRAVQITRVGGPEVLDVVDLPDPVPGDGQQLFDVSTAGVDHADTHHRPS